MLHVTSNRQKLNDNLKLREELCCTVFNLINRLSGTIDRVRQVIVGASASLYDKANLDARGRTYNMFLPVRPNLPCQTSLMMHLRSPTIHERLCRIPAQYLQTIDQDENGTAQFFTQFKIVIQFLSIGSNMEHQQFKVKTLLNGFKNVP